MAKATVTSMMSKAYKTANKGHYRKRTLKDVEDIEQMYEFFKETEAREFAKIYAARKYATM